MSRSESVSSQKKASISIPPLTASSVTSPMSDGPLTSVSTRHFELPVVMEEDDEKSENSISMVRRREAASTERQAQLDQEQFEIEVFDHSSATMTFPAELGANYRNHKLIDASTQTSVDKFNDSDWLSLRRDILYQFIPLPPSNSTTPSASHCNLENY